MARPLEKRRLEVPGGLYFVRLWSPEGAFSPTSMDDTKLLEDCIEWAVLHSGAELYAYSWLPRSINLLLKVSECHLAWSGDSLELVVKRICGRYAQARNRRMGRSGELFHREYAAKLVDPDRYLLNVVRYIHLLPVAQNLCADPGGYPSSSHRAYLGKMRIRCLAPTPVLDALKNRAPSSRRAYETFMEKHESVRVAGLIEHGSDYDSRIIGDGLFVERMLKRSTHYRPGISRDQLAAAAAYEFQISRESIFSTSQRTSDVIEARALIAWQAMRNGMRPGAIAKWLGNTWANFLTTIHRHRPHHRELFDLPLVELINNERNRGVPRGVRKTPTAWAP